MQSGGRFSAHNGRSSNYDELPKTTLMLPSRSRQLARAAAGSRHTWYLSLVGLTGGKGQCWACRRKSVRFRMLQGWMVTRIPALIFGGILEIGVYSSCILDNTLYGCYALWIRRVWIWPSKNPILGSASLVHSR